jgi:hypothetical protein
MTLARAILLLALGTFGLACSVESTDASDPDDGDTGTVSQAMCYPVPEPSVSEVIPKFDCAPAAGRIVATAPAGYTQQACTSYFMIEGIEEAHTPGCHFSVYFGTSVKQSDIPTTAARCTQSYVDQVVRGYKNGTWTLLRNARTYGVWNSNWGACDLGTVGWVLYDAQNLGYEKFRFSTHAYKTTALGSFEAGVTARLEEGL